MSGYKDNKKYQTELHVFKVQNIEPAIEHSL